ncbi:MAG: hypothetical protein EOM26_06885, partial [Alphaproteobacteria bacterium]|nr:hypothetical protein [Alphaproteobacteria bacterium]
DEAFLLEGVAMNRKLAEAGLEKGVGAGFGVAYREMAKGNLVLKAKSYTAAASDARMGGLGFPAMSCATSGNVGITAMLPLVVMAEELGRGEEEMLRAVALSYLLTILMKRGVSLMTGQDLSGSALRCVVVSDGIRGHLHQARGVALWISRRLSLQSSSVNARFRASSGSSVQRRRAPRSDRCTREPALMRGPSAKPQW